MITVIAYSLSYVGIKHCESEFDVEEFDYVKYFKEHKWIHHVEVYTQRGMRIIRRDEI